MKVNNILAGAALMVSLSSSAEPVNVNSASADELATALSGIGATKAAAIVAHRSEFGPFIRVEDLVAVTGIGERLIENIKADLRLDDKQD